jgi:hypothetical protein
MHARTLSFVLAIFVTLALPDSSVAQAVSVTGRILDVRLGNGERLQGELIEAMGGNLTLAEETGLRAIDLSDVSSIRAKRHSFDGKKVAVWIGVGALVTGLGMTAACNSYEGSSGCGQVFPAIVLSWALIGGLFGSGLASTAWTDVPMTDDLRRFARFPQGAPANAAARGDATSRRPRVP